MASKKKGLSLKLLLSACAALLAVVTLILLVAPGMSPKNDFHRCCLLRRRGCSVLYRYADLLRVCSRSVKGRGEGTLH